MLIWFVLISIPLAIATDFWWPLGLLLQILQAIERWLDRLEKRSIARNHERQYADAKQKWPQYK